MNWPNRWAQRTSAMKRSAVRELLKLTAQPGIISLAGGLPAEELFPVDDLAEATRTVLQTRPSAALQYGETEGVGELRDWVAARHSTPSRPITRANVLITSGAQQALDLIGRILLDPGDRVAVENPTYLALLSAWRPLGVEFVGCRPGHTFSGVPAAAPGQGTEPTQPAKLAYVVPNFANPTGRTLTVIEREALLAQAGQVDALVLEDDPYGDLRYSGEPQPSLWELEGSSSSGGVGLGRVIRTGTFSKTLMPGLRVGWAIAAPQVIDRLVQAKQAVDLHTSTLTQHLILELLRCGVLDRHRARLVETYRQRRDALLEALSEHPIPGLIWTEPEGGMFVFVTLPEGWDAAELLPRAIERGVAFVPGAEFHLDGQGANTLRLNFTHATPDRLREAVRRLHQAMGSRLNC
jgi:2-aminoadipate transaminase